MAISDQASDQIDEGIDRTAMAGMLDLRNVLELVNDTLDDGSFSQQQLVDQANETVLHVLPDPGDQLEVEGFAQ